MHRAKANILLNILENKDTTRVVIEYAIIMSQKKMDIIVILLVVQVHIHSARRMNA